MNRRTFTKSLLALPFAELLSGLAEDDADDIATSGHSRRHISEGMATGEATMGSGQIITVSDSTPTWQAFMEQSISDHINESVHDVLVRALR